MKIKSIIIALSVAVLATACAEDSIAPSYDSLTVSSNFISLPAEGGEVTFTVNATEEWSIYKPLLPTHDDDGELIWDLKVTPESGKAGPTTITVSTDATLSTREAELCIVIGDRTALDAAYKALTDLEAEYDAECAKCLTKAEEKAVDKIYEPKIKDAEAAVNALLVSADRQYVTAKQTAGKQEIEYVTCEDVNAGADGPVYYVKGSVTKIVNTLYGNWTLKDDTGDVYIYGTLDANGQEKNFESLGLAEGDEVYLSGPKTTYNGTVELVNVTIHKINKAFIKLNENSVEVDKEAGSIEIPLTLMDGAKWTASTDADWLTIGTTHLDEGNTILTVDYAAYDELKAPRTGVITFSATKEVEEENEEGEKEKVTKSAFLEYKVTQYGIVPKPVSVKDAAAAEKNAWIAVEGIVTAVCGDGIIVTDKDGDFILGYKAEAELGDEVILYGKRGAYNKSYQLASPVVEVKSKGNKYTYPVATPVTEEFIADLAAASGDQLAKFVTYTGVVNDNKYNTLNVGENYVISPYTSSDFLMKNAKGKTVTIEGYTYGYKSSANQLNVIVTSLKYAE